MELAHTQMTRDRISVVPHLVPILGSGFFVRALPNDLLDRLILRLRIIIGFIG